MTAGVFTRTYEHWRFTTTQDDFGQPVENWVDDVERYARAEVTSGREFRQFETLQQVERTTFYVERDTPADPADNRIKWAGKVWNIVSAPDPRRNNERMIHTQAVNE